MKTSILSQRTAKAICLFSAVFASALLSANCSCEHDSDWNDNSGWDSSCLQKGVVFASYRSDQTQNISPGGNVGFNVTDTNEGRGIHYDNSSGEFLIKKAGTYSIDYGIGGNVEVEPRPSDGSKQIVGFSLVVVDSCGTESIKDQIFGNASSNIFLHLVPGDRVKLVVQPSQVFGNIRLDNNIFQSNSGGTKTTQFLSDTSYMTFVRMK